MTSKTVGPGKPRARQVRQVNPPQPPPEPVVGQTQLTPAVACLLPAAISLALGLFALVPQVRLQPKLFWTFLGTSGLLLACAAWLWASARRLGRTLVLEVVLRKQHYLQACAQSLVLLYWGFYWRPVYGFAYLILAQILFAYALDMMLSWSRRDTYTLGFGPVPVIFSINLFLWFKTDWFYLQFLMVATGFAAKELIRWNKDGRRVHVFNPSSFPLGLFSLVLILTGTTGMTFGPEIANTLFRAPQIYLFIFLIALPGQLLFGVTTMTMSAAVTMYGFGLLYFGMTGTYFFFDEYIPIAVFLGMHLLFTDPSTAPRTELGRLMFGVLYATSVMVLYALAGTLGIPTFYDKLLPVPVLNLMIRGIDGVARWPALAWLDPSRIGRALTGRRRYAAYTGVWIVVFILMSVAQGVGDTHRGHWVPFWQQACRENRRNACRNLAQMEARYCENGSGWACNELGVLFLASANLQSPGPAVQMFGRACDQGFAPGCENREAARRRAPVRQADPMPADYQIVLREGKGPLPALTPAQLNDRACQQGWAHGCDQLASACKAGDADACAMAVRRGVR